MQLTGYRTKLVEPGDDLEEILAESLSVLPERSIVTVASKIISTCQDRFVVKQADSKEEKFALVRQEAEFFLPASSSKYEVMLTVKGNWMFANAGIDESNAAGQYILWPEDLQSETNKIWRFLRNHFGVKELGVTVSDSRSQPLNWGVTGHAIAHCGFNPLISYIGVPDLFGRKMKMEQLNVAQSVTAAAALVMGEGAEQTPLAVASQLPEAVEFLDHEPTEQELTDLHIELADDIFAPLLTAVDWQKGGARRS